MARTRYKQKPQFWYCVQYGGTNVAEMTDFCPDLVFNAEEQRLMFGPTLIVQPTDWMLEDMAGSFSLMINEQFVAFFDLAPGGP